MLQAFAGQPAVPVAQKLDTQTVRDTLSASGTVPPDATPLAMQAYITVPMFFFFAPPTGDLPGGLQACVTGAVPGLAPGAVPGMLPGLTSSLLPPGLAPQGVAPMETTFSIPS